MTKGFEFKTARGAQIKFVAVINHVTSKEIDADGFKVTVDADDWTYSVKSLTINGKSQRGEFTLYHDKHVIRFGYKGNMPMLIALPANVVDQIFGAQERREASKLSANIEADKKYQAHYNSVRRAMCDE